VIYKNSIKLTGKKEAHSTLLMKLTQNSVKLIAPNISKIKIILRNDS